MESGVSWLLLYLKVCSVGWLFMYAFISLGFGLITNLTLHVMMLGLIICLVSYLRLPPPNSTLVRKVLGQQPEPGMSDALVDWEVAHRAACLDAPENSIEALHLAKQNGARVVEFDVSFTSDMSAVVFHDDTLDRITQASGPITGITNSNLKKLDLSSKHPLGSSFKFVAVPDLENFVEECIKLNMKMIIDLKTYEVPEETAAVILGLYAKFPAMKSITIVTSFFPHLLYRLRRQDPDIVCSMSTRPFFLSSTTYDGTTRSLKKRYGGLKHLVALMVDLVYPWLLQNFLWFFIGLSAVLVHKAMITPEYVSDWRSKGVRVMAWTVNDPLEKAFLRHNRGVQVLTDTLEKLKPDQWVIKE